LQIEHADSDVSSVVTVSIGVSMSLPDGDGDSARLLSLVDAQLYRAKHSGRGRACGAVLGAKA
jgi:PleD family two-component response regulator